MQFLALQQFVPQERKPCASCIWCGQVAPVNRAHIISRKLTTGARNAPTLRFNVCKTCNSTCGRLEEWILRSTPLSWLRMMLYLRPGSEGTTRYVPSYFFSAMLNDWVVFHLDGKTRSYVVSSQLILSPEFGAKLLTEAPQELHEQLLSRITAALRDKSYNIDIRGSLPLDFSPRLLIDKERILLIARTEIESQRFTEDTVQLVKQARNAERLCMENTGREQHHFQWSKVNWARRRHLKHCAFLRAVKSAFAQHFSLSGNSFFVELGRKERRLFLPRKAHVSHRTFRCPSSST